jgi:hypothetical protein
MIAGTLALLEEPADEPLEDYHDSGRRAVDVDASHTYLDSYRVQTGRIAGRVSTETERVIVDGSHVEIERRDTEETVATPFVADVTDDGWILAERTHSTDEEHRPPWPFSQFQVVTGANVTPMGLDVPAFVERQEREGRNVSIEMTSHEREHSGDTRINWERRNLEQGKRANVGAALTVEWRGEFVRLVVYESGYTAIWEPENAAPSLVARFVHDELIPVAVPLDEDEGDEETTEQQEVTNA